MHDHLIRILDEALYAQRQLRRRQPGQVRAYLERIEAYARQGLAAEQKPEPREWTPEEILAREG